ncbi:MAG TPA: enoyl-CoA hydratase-related protein [Candidatus Binataceae bacterium]|nr:enoyl-CoA hydratase-related protein [Candidatus Binataceae bacterium]
MAYETLLYEVSGDIATVTLNRPAKMNAYTTEMGIEIADAMLRADADPGARVVIMTGAGERAFCAGADMAMFASNINSREQKAEEDDGAERSRRAISLPMIMRGLSKPTIAAINGYALGVGCTIPLLFDVRVASANAKMGVIFPRVGLMSELGSSYLMPRLIGLARTAEMMLTGRQYSAEQCLAMGLVSQVFPAAQLMAKTRELAGEMLECSPLSLAMTRRALYQGLDGTLETAMQFEGFALEKCYVSAEHKEYVSAFLAKRKPDFRKLNKG